MKNAIFAMLVVFAAGSSQISWAACSPCMANKNCKDPNPSAATGGQTGTTSGVADAPPKVEPKK